MKSKSVIIHKSNYEHTQILAASDVHWDNPKCDRKLLKKDFDEAVKRNAKIILPGDFFCAMQGQADPRKMKGDIRPEHNNNKYFDSLVETAAEWLLPYKDNILMFGYGNHETNIVKRQETDLLQRLVTLLNYQGASIELGGYGGWIVFNFVRSGRVQMGYKIKYMHGWGGGGAVTKGTIQFNRIKTWVEGADMILMGHVHEDHELSYQVEYINGLNIVHQKRVLMVRSATYKEEYQDGTRGWHVMTGKPPKPMGGRWIHLMPKPGKKISDYIEAYTEPTVKC
jgi:UDP-2,3-diacylglucosamine pyrophosphatase LpxH